MGAAMSDNPFESPHTSPAPAESTQPGLTSLAQSQRQKKLNLARGFIFFVGILTIAVNAYYALQAKSLVEAEVNKAVRNAGGFAQVDHAAVDDAVRFLQVVSWGFVAVGVVYIVLGFLVKAYPVPITITALVLYIVGQLITAVFDPSMVFSGIILKVIIIVVLAQAISAAVAYERERKREEMAAFGASPSF